MKRSFFNKTVRQITNRLLPNIRHKGAITALCLGIGIAVIGAVARTVSPSPTQVEQNARRNKLLKFEIIAMVVCYIQYEEKFWLVSRETSGFLKSAMRPLMKEYAKIGTRIPTDRDLLNVMDLVLRNMTDNERIEFANVCTDSLKTINRLISDCGQHPDQEGKKEQISEGIKLGGEPVAKFVLEVICSKPGLKEVVEGMLNKKTRYNPDLFMQKVKQNAQKQQ